MPVRSLNSSVLKWPDFQAVHAAACEWASRLVQRRADVLRIGYIGSYARGDWGVGSDLDLIVILAGDDQPIWGRSAGLDISGFPVPVDVLVYTQPEWQQLEHEGGRFFRTVQAEAVWIYSLCQ